MKKTLCHGWMKCAQIAVIAGMAIAVGACNHDKPNAQQLLGYTKVQQVQARTPTCGSDAKPTTSLAVCPAKFKVVGGGYMVTSYGPQPGAQNIAPSDSVAQGNGWQVLADASDGKSCFTAYAMCGQ